MRHMQALVSWSPLIAAGVLLASANFLVGKRRWKCVCRVGKWWFAAFMRLIKANHLKKGFIFTKVQVNGLANYLGMGHYWCSATSMQGCTLGLLLKRIGWANISLDTPQPNLTQSQIDNFCWSFVRRWTLSLVTLSLLNHQVGRSLCTMWVPIHALHWSLPILGK